MKRFWTFSGDTYYPIGGMQDFKGSFDTKEEASAFLLKKFNMGFEWFHIYDSQECKVVMANRTTAEYCDRYRKTADNRFTTLPNQGEVQ